MTEYSEAAKAYAAAVGASERGIPYPWYIKDLSAAFDAGAAPAAAPSPEPVLLTDPDDPRIRVGALVRIETTYSDDDESTHYIRRIADGAGWSGRAIRDRIDSDAAVYLLAEADPDADTRQALIEIMTGIGVHDLTTDEATQVIMGLRERGVTL